MALIVQLERMEKTRGSIHAPVDCCYAVVEADGQKVLQLETYGTSYRKKVGKTSQTIQLTRESAMELKRIIETTFS